MIKVIIIDDESIVRKGLIATIDWNKYNMAVIGDAANGQKGWELFLEQSPEVVITDIVMPEMNGIELAKKIKQTAPDTKILLLSCHRDFEYAQEGMKLGASGYILKTAFQDEEFEAYLKQFSDEIRKEPAENTGLSKEFYEWLCGFDNSFAAILEDKCQSEWEWINRPFYIYHLNHLSEQQLDTHDTAERIVCGHDQCFMFVPETHRDSFEASLVKAKQLAKDLQWNQCGPNKGTEEWMNGVLSLYSKFKMEQQFKVDIDQWPEPIQKAVQLMTGDLTQSYSSVDVAYEVGLSRSHFSTLFKKSVGESFYSFTERIKLNAACELLNGTSLTLQQISEKVGIQDGKYFSKWFKKCTGQTPSEYRQTKRRNHDNNITPDRKKTKQYDD